MQFGDFFRSKKKGWFLNRGGGGVDIKFNSPSTQLYMFAKGGAGGGVGEWCVQERSDEGRLEMG